jgi:2-haloacid dehalogenase
MTSYNSLSTFPDVPPALSALSSLPNIMPVIFSNGTLEMVSNSINHSTSLSHYKSCFEKLVSVDETHKFKPDPRVYKFLAKEVGKVPDEMGEIWLVSSNPFDVVGARAAGMKAAWIDREGKGWLDALVPGEGGGPSVVVRGLMEAIEAVMRVGTRA